MNFEQIPAALSVVLLYHRVGWPRPSSKVSGQYVAPLLFRSQLGYLPAHGWKAVSLADSISGCADSSPLRQNQFSLTFDDAYQSVYRHAFPALKSRSMTATIYVVADAVGGLNEWDMRIGDVEERLMTREQIIEMAENGFEIGSHTLSHPRLTQASVEQVVRELADSKKKIEDMIGREVVSFSYPYGNYNQRVLESAMAAGYKNAVSTKLGTVVSGINLFEIPRINVRWNAITPLLMRKIERARKRTLE